MVVIKVIEPATKAHLGNVRRNRDVRSVFELTWAMTVEPLSFPRANQPIVTGYATQWLPGHCSQCLQRNESWRRKHKLCAQCARKQTRYDYRSRGTPGRSRPCSRCRTLGHYASTCTINR